MHPRLFVGMRKCHMKNLISLHHTGLFALLLFAASCQHHEAPAPAKPVLRTASFTYTFNSGQLGNGTAYEGEHPQNLSAVLTIEEMNANRCRVKLLLNNVMEGKTYLVHTHNAADPLTTPNFTPYDESPNADILSMAITGAGHSHSGHGHRISHVTAKGEQQSPFSFDYLTQQYDGFLVVHDPLKPLSTTDLKTYLVVNKFAR